MYIVDFFKTLTRKSNIPVLIYLVLNIFVIAGITSFLLSMNFGLGLLVGLGLYAISLLIALSPIGEFILRFQNGCKKIKDPELFNFIEPIFREVYGKAVQADPSISPDISLYLNNDRAPNAFATGRKTICITKGLLNMPVEQIKATLAHEFGHLSHKDTDLILVVAVGNLIVTGFIVGIRIIITLVHLFISLICIVAGGPEGAIAGAINSLHTLLITAIVSGLTWIWTKIGTLLVMKASRSNEFEADEFASKLGYGNDLCILLDTICASNATGLFANLASSHPDKADRIAKLQELGASYRKAIPQNTPHLMGG